MSAQAWRDYETPAGLLRIPLYTPAHQTRGASSATLRQPRNLAAKLPGAAAPSFDCDIADHHRSAE